MPMFTRIPGPIREVDEDGEDDAPITPVPPAIPLTTETGIELSTEDGTTIFA